MDLRDHVVGAHQGVVERHRLLGELTGAREALAIGGPQKLPALQMRPGQSQVGPSVVGIEIERPHEQASRLGVAFACRPVALLGSAKHEIVRLEHFGRRPAEADLLGLGELHRHGANDLLGDLVLEGEDVADLAVVALGPEVIAGGRVHELRRDAHAVARTLHAALQDVAHAEVAAHLADLHRPALVGEDRVARDDEEPGHLREPGDQVLGDTVAEVVLRRVLAQVREGQHGDRRPVRQRKARGLGGEPAPAGPGGGSQEQQDRDGRGDCPDQPPRDAAL